MKSSAGGTTLSSSVHMSATSAGPTSLYPVIDFVTASNALQSHNIQQVVKGLNYLLLKSFEANQDSTTSTVVQLENHPRLFHSISDLLDLLNPVANLIEKELDLQISYHVLSQQEIDGHAWSTDLLGSKNDEFKFMTKFLDENPMYLSLLASIRNMSFEMINENILAMNVTLLKHIVCILAGTAIHAVSMDVTQLAFDIACNIAHRFDFSARKRSQVSSSYFEEQNKDALRFTVSRHMSNSGTVLYMQLLRSLMHTLGHLLHEDNYISRYFVLRSLELLSKLVNANEKEPFVKNAVCPLIVTTLSKYLAVSTTRVETDLIPDGLAVSSGDPLGRTRPSLSTLPPSVYNMIIANNSPAIPGVNLPQGVSYRKLVPASYLTSDCIDFELRDLAIDCLLGLCRNSPANAQHLHGMPRVVDLILRLAKMPTTAGSVGITNGLSSTNCRTEGNNKAAALLAAIIGGANDSTQCTNRVKRMRTSLIFHTTCDEHIADVTCNKVQPSFLSGIVEKVSLNSGETQMQYV